MNSSMVCTVYWNCLCVYIYAKAVTFSEETDDKDESSLVDARVQVLKKTKINKITNQVNGAAHSVKGAAGGLSGAVGGLPGVAGVAGGLTKGLGEALPSPIPGLLRRKRDVKTVNKKTKSKNNKSQNALIGALDGAVGLASGALPAVDKLPNAADGLTNGGLNGLPAVGNVASDLTNQQKLVGKIKQKCI